MVIRNLSYSLISQVLLVIISFGSLAILGRLLEPSIFGIYALLLAIHSLLFPIVDFGLTPVYVKINNPTDETKNVFFTLNIILGFIYSIFYVIISMFVEEESFVEYSLIFIFSVIIIAYNQQSLANLIREHQQKKLMFINSVSTLLSAIIAIFLAYKTYGIYSLLAQQLSNQIFRTILLKIIYYRSYKIVNISIIKKHSSDIIFSLKILSSRVVNGLSLSYDKFLVGNMFGVASLGFYSKSFELSRFPNANIGVALSSPMLSFLARKSEAKSRILYSSVGNVIFYISGNILLFLLVYGDWFMVFLLGDQWVEAGLYLQILSIWGLGKVLHGILITIYTNEKKMGLFTIYSLIGLIVNFIIFCVAYITTKDIIYTIALFSISNFLIWTYIYLFSLYKYGNKQGLKDSIVFLLLNGIVFVFVSYFIRYTYFDNSEYKLIVAFCSYLIAMLAAGVAIILINKKLLFDIKKLKDEDI